MLRNYLKIAWRTLWRHKGATTISVTGLAVGMACCLWLLLVVQHEWSYDRFHEDVDQIVRITQELVRADGSVEHGALLPPPLGPTLAAAAPEAAAVVRVQRSSFDVTAEDRTVERRITFADPTFFDVFTAPAIEGNPRATIAAPDRLVLTESESLRLFGNAGAVGRSLTLHFDQGPREMMVGAIVEDPPATTSVPYSILLSIEQTRLTMPEGFSDQLMETWAFGTMNTFARLHPDQDAKAINSTLQEIRDAHLENPERHTLRAQPLTDVRHATAISGGLAPTNEPRVMYILAGIAALILLIAAINFVTLTLGQSTRRSREVGVRKALGATQGQLAQQFWWEAVVVCALALFIGLGVAHLFRPAVAELIDIPIQFGIVDYPVFWLSALTLVLGIGLLAGGYPSWVLARMEATDVLRSQRSVRTRGLLSRGLIVVQFAVSVGFVACAFIMSQQLQHMTDSDLGYTDAPLLTLTVDRDLGDTRFEAFQREAARHPAIQSVAGSWTTFGQRGNRVEFEQRTGEVRTAYFNQVTLNYPEAMGLRVVEGQPFDEEGISRGMLVNEQLVRELNLEDPIGQTLTVHNANPITASFTDLPIVGVLADFHVTGLDEAIPPLLLVPHEAVPFGLLRYTAQLQPDRTQDGIRALTAVWSTVFPDQPFDYTFLQDQVAAQYETEARWRALVGYAALLALLIACFGIFGTAALEVARRQKEIGIRKVLGASASSLVAHLSKDLVRLVALGAVLAVPAAYLAMTRWLENFAYRIEPAWWMFAAAGAVALIVALATASYHTLRAAWMDPTQAIQNE